MAYAAGECHLAENTVAAYRRDLTRFFAWLDGRKHLPSLSIRDLADYVAWLHGRELAPASIARHIVSLKVFFRYLQLEGALTENLAELLGSQKLWERVPKVLSPEQIDRLLAAPGQTDPWWRRDRALLELLYATGCRASELSRLRLLRHAPGRGLLPLPRQGRQGAAGAAGRPGSRGGPGVPRTRAAEAGRPPPPAGRLDAA